MYRANDHDAHNGARGEPTMGMGIRGRNKPHRVSFKYASEVLASLQWQTSTIELRLAAHLVMLSATI